MPDRIFLPLTDRTGSRVSISVDRDITHYVPETFLARDYDYEHRAIHNAINERAEDDNSHVMHLLRPHFQEMASLKKSVLLFQHHAECMEIDERVLTESIADIDFEMGELNKQVRDKNRLLEGLKTKLKEERDESQNKLRASEKTIAHYRSYGQVTSYSLCEDAFKVQFVDGTQRTLTRNECMTYEQVNTRLMDTLVENEVLKCQLGVLKLQNSSEKKQSLFTVGQVVVCICDLSAPRCKGAKGFVVNVDDERNRVHALFSTAGEDSVCYEVPPCDLILTPDQPNPNDLVGKLVYLEDDDKWIKGAVFQYSTEHDEYAVIIFNVTHAEQNVINVDYFVKVLKKWQILLNKPPIADENAASPTGVIPSDRMFDSKAISRFLKKDDSSTSGQCTMYPPVETLLAQANDSKKVEVAMISLPEIVSKRDLSDYLNKHSVCQKITTALQSVVDSDILPGNPIMALAMALVPDNVILQHSSEPSVVNPYDPKAEEEEYNPREKVLRRINRDICAQLARSEKQCGQWFELSSEKEKQKQELLERLISAEKQYEELRLHALGLGQSLSKSQVDLQAYKDRMKDTLARLEQVEKDRNKDILEKAEFERMNKERHDAMIRVNQLATEYKEMKHALSVEKEEMNDMISARTERLDREFAKIPECMVCLEQGPFSWMYKGCKHISVCDACHASGQVKQCPKHDQKQKFDKVERIYFTF